MYTYSALKSSLTWKLIFGYQKSHPTIFNITIYKNLCSNYLLTTHSKFDWMNFIVSPDLLWNSHNSVYWVVDVLLEKGYTSKHHVKCPHTQRTELGFLGLGLNIIPCHSPATATPQKNNRVWCVMFQATFVKYFKPKWFYPRPFFGFRILSLPVTVCPYVGACLSQPQAYLWINFEPF